MNVLPTFELSKSEMGLTHQKVSLVKECSFALYVSKIDQESMCNA